MKTKSVDFDLNRMINTDLIITDYQADDNLVVLRKLSELLRVNGFVNSEFQEAILKREKDYPTGLVTKTINVAIPHTEPEYVLKPGLAIASLKEPVSFYQMDKPEKIVKVDIVFMLAIKRKQNQVLLIQKLISAFQEPELLMDLKNCHHPACISKTLISFFNRA